jgi:hypothetical protein
MACVIYRPTIRHRGFVGTLTTDVNPFVHMAKRQ